MKHLLDIPDLDARAFLPVLGRMRLYGKSDAPPPPDYVGQANATAAGNLQAARSQTSANRVNQVTPYGSINYTQGTGIDQQGYDTAMDSYRQQQARINANPALRQYYGATGELLQAPDRSNYVTNPDQWSSQIQLSDTGQQLLDANNRSMLGLAGLQDSAMDRVRQAQSQPFDMSGLQDMQTNVDPATGMDAWDRATDLIRQRQNPQLDQQQSALDTKLANQGLTAGSEGWGIQQQNFGRTRNDADIAAQMAGLQAQQQFFGQAVQNAGLKNSSRNQQLTERTALRQMPLNELNALRSGAQVQNPTFSTPGQQGQTSGPDLMGAAGQQYGAAVGNVNAQNQQAAQTTSAGVGLASAAASIMFY